MGYAGFGYVWLEDLARRASLVVYDIESYKDYGKVVYIPALFELSILSLSYPSGAQHITLEFDGSPEYNDIFYLTGLLICTAWPLVEDCSPDPSPLCCWYCNYQKAAPLRKFLKWNLHHVLITHHPHVISSTPLLIQTNLQSLKHLLPFLTIQSPLQNLPLHISQPQPQPQPWPSPPASPASASLPPARPPCTRWSSTWTTYAPTPPRCSAPCTPPCCRSCARSTPRASRSSSASRSSPGTRRPRWSTRPLPPCCACSLRCSGTSARCVHEHWKSRCW